jgi:hypothetical protein
VAKNQRLQITQYLGDLILYLAMVRIIAKAKEQQLLGHGSYFSLMQHSAVWIVDTFPMWESFGL